MKLFSRRPPASERRSRDFRPSDWTSASIPPQRHQHKADAAERERERVRSGQIYNSLDRSADPAIRNRMQNAPHRHHNPASGPPFRATVKFDLIDRSIVGAGWCRSCSRCWCWGGCCRLRCWFNCSPFMVQYRVDDRLRPPSRSEQFASNETSVQT